MVKLIIDYISLPQADILLLGQKVLGAFTDNDNYPSPDPDLKTLEVNITTYKNALGISGRNQPKTNNIAKNKARLVLATSLASLAHYAMDTTPDEEEALSTTLLPMYKTRRPVGPLAPPETVTVTQGMNSGELVVESSKIPQAWQYELMIAPVVAGAAPVWSTYTYSKRKYILKGLVPGTEYRIKVAGAAADPSRNFSAEVLRFAA